MFVAWAVRMVCAGLIWAMAYISVELFCDKNMERVQIAKQLLEQMNWRDFQANFSFKMVQVENANGGQICFETAVGRREMVKAALIKLNGRFP
jgi:hypothetical protein